LRKPFPKIIFLNQVSGRLFRELASGLADEFGFCTIYTKYDKFSEIFQVSPNLKVNEAPEYHRGNICRRIFDWLFYFLYVFFKTIQSSKESLLFIVSNPPFLPLVGYILKKMRGQNYVVLVYDIYPDLAINLYQTKSDSFISRIWIRFNRIIWDNSAAVITIGEKMAINLHRYFEPQNTKLGKLAVIPNWADASFIKPMPKEENWFAKQYNQIGKFTVLYSGNLGATHDIETMLAAAKCFKYTSGIEFIIIGEGFKRALIEETMNREVLDNILLLPYQSENVLPFSLAVADVAIVTLAKGAEGLSVPSKVYYAMASGAALLSICSGDNELRRLVEENKCGLCIEPGDVQGFSCAIEKFYRYPDFLNSCKYNSRRAMERDYNINNIKKYKEILEQFIN
jgi:glycosyltransferase involved in cell wall biosynthesis